jgi:hypothetical protein
MIFPPVQAAQCSEQHSREKLAMTANEKLSEPVENGDNLPEIAQDGMVDVELDLDEDLLAELKNMAAERGCTIDKIINDALETACREAFMKRASETCEAHGKLIEELS